MYGTRTRQRLEHLSLLNAIPSLESEEFERWSRTRLNRILVDYLLRQGYSASAEKLAQDVGIGVNCTTNSQTLGIRGSRALCAITNNRDGHTKSFVPGSASMVQGKFISIKKEQGN